MCVERKDGMRGTKAKKLRKLVYGGKPTNAAGRKYFVAKYEDTYGTQIFTDKARMLYQKAKEVFKEDVNE